MRIKGRQWLTKDCGFNDKVNKSIPVPMRTMHGKILDESPKMYQVELEGRPEPSSECLHCGRTLTHPVSVLYGVGPECGKHYYITSMTEAELKANMEDIRAKLAEVKWTGWIPKSSVEIEYDTKYVVEYKYQGKQYRSIVDKDTLVKIHEKAVEVHITEEVLQ